MPPESASSPAPVRNLVLVLGDQLDPGNAALDRLDRRRDAILMYEVADEATYIAQHRQHLVRLLRRRREILMDGDKRVGGQWNFDAENRERLGGNRRMSLQLRNVERKSADERRAFARRAARVRTELTAESYL